jgi:outer membrane protein TolC
MKKSLYFTLIIAICSIVGLVPTEINGQEPLRLQDAIAIGLEKNFDIRIEKLREEIAVNNNTWGNAGLFPQLNLVANQQNSYNDQDNPASFINGQFETHSINFGAEANWTLFNGLRVYVNKNRLETLAQQSRGNATLVIQNTVQAIILAYERAILEKEKLQVQERIKNLSKDEYFYNLEKEALGSIGSYDLLQVKNAYFTDSASFINQEVVTRTAQRELNLLLGLPFDTNFYLTDSLVAPVNTYRYDALEGKLLSNNQNLKNQYINQRIRQYDYQLARKNLYPSIDLRSGVQQTENSLTFETPNGEQRNQGNTFNYYFNFSLSFNVYNGGATQRAIDNAEIEKNIAALSSEQLEESVKNELKVAVDNYNTRLKVYAINKANLKTTELNLNLSREKYQNGSISSFDFRAVQNNYMQISSNTLESIYSLIESHTELLRLTGGILSSAE